MEKEKTCNEVVSIANKYKADKYTDESTITLTISFEKFIEMDRLVKIGEATEKAYDEGYDLNINVHPARYRFKNIQSLLEWAESEGE